MNYWHMKVDPLPYQRVHFTVSDCIDKKQQRYDDYYCDEMLNDTVTIDIFPPFDSHDEQSHLYRGFNRSSPIILYAPGLKCHSQDLPGTSIVRRAYEAGFRSIVVNRRSHIPNSKLSSPRWNLFGGVDDMEQGTLKKGKCVWYMSKKNQCEINLIMALYLVPYLTDQILWVSGFIPPFSNENHFTCCVRI